MTGTISEGKAVLIGPMAVGKTALSNKIHFKLFSEDYQSTIGAGNYLFETTVNGAKFSLQIWDTAGMERYKTLGPIYYRGAQSAIFVFDVTRENTRKELDIWYDTFIDSIGNDFYGIVVGNKIDLVTDTKVQELSLVRNMMEWAKLKGFDFILTSAKEGTNVEALFQKAANGSASILLKDMKKSNPEQEIHEDGGKNSFCC